LPSIRTKSSEKGGEVKKLEAPHYGAAENGRFKSGLPKLSSINTGEIADMTYNATLNGQSLVGELDPGATDVFMSEKAATLCGLSIEMVDIKVELGDG